MELEFRGSGYDWKQFVSRLRQYAGDGDETAIQVLDTLDRMAKRITAIMQNAAQHVEDEIEYFEQFAGDTE